MRKTFPNVTENLMKNWAIVSVILKVSTIKNLSKYVSNVIIAVKHALVYNHK